MVDKPSINEFLVTTLDALMHLSSALALACIALLACRLLTRGHVDAKIVTGLKIATLLVIARVILLNTVGHLLPSASAQTQEIAIIAGLYIAAFILVYKLITIPVLGTTLSAAAIVFAQLSLANYVPQLSLQLMPEGQRFAEFTGLDNKRTQAITTGAKAFRDQAGGLHKVLLNKLKAFTDSDHKQAQGADSRISLDQANPTGGDSHTLETLAFEQHTQGIENESARIQELPHTPHSDTKPLSAGDDDHTKAPDLVNGEVAYYMPKAETVIPVSDTDLPIPQELASPLVVVPEQALEKNYFKLEELHPIVTEQSIVLIPEDATSTEWRAVSDLIKIDAWFAAADDSGRSTIFIEGNALQDGDTWEHRHQDGHLYRFAFKGIENNLITLVALERTSVIK